MSLQRLILYLKGGLGNQLFGIYAAIALEEEFEVDCEILTHGIDLNHKSGDSDATAFQFGRNLNFVTGRSLNERLFNYANTRKIAGISEFNSIFRGRAMYIERNDHKKTLSDLSKLLAKSRAVELGGYFQDFSYFNKVEKLLPVFTLDESTDWLVSQRKHAASLRPIIIHIRLGDYLQNGMQILSKSYFNEALHEMSRVVETDDVWVFSDSPNQARNFLDTQTSKKVRFFENDQKSTETFMLMREGSGLICSNSTFSYWAGRTGCNNRPVIYPRKFSHNSELQIRSIPEEWIVIDN